MKALVRHFGVARTGLRCLSSALWDVLGGGEDGFSTVANRWQFTVFHRIGSDVQIQRKKSKLFITDTLNACNKCIRVQRDMHRAVTELTDISLDGFISKFLHV